MKLLLFSFLLLTHLLALENRQLLMNSISHHAIKIGTGANKTYTFLDPLCPRSQEYVKLILNRPDLQKETSHYIFLYKLPRFDSRELIVYIYQSTDPLAALIQVMVHEDYEDIEVYETKEKTLKIIHEITKVAKQMNVKKRPYLLIFNQGSNYCRVSEGTAPCLEENDFE